MNPIFIYQNEAKLDNNNKFTIDFIDEEVVNLVSFFSKNQYYISSLDCNITKANKKKFRLLVHKLLLMIYPQ